MAAQNVLVLKSFQAPESPGVHYCLFCLSGEGKGEAYFLIGDRVVLGRSQKADIILKDLKASREHAEVSRSQGDFMIRDLDSQNGIFINDKKMRESFLREGDKILIGNTFFRFGSVEVEGVPSAIAFRQKNSPFPAENSSSPKKKIILVLAVVLLGYLFFSEEEVPQERKKKEIEITVEKGSDDVTSKILEQKYKEDKELQAKLDAIFQRGLREYREGNYFRAINEFSLALILSPSNSRGLFYLNKTKQALDQSIEDKFIMAKKYIEALKYDEAKVAYCSIIRLLKDYTNDERYKSALDNIKELEILMGLVEGEIKCF